MFDWLGYTPPNGYTLRNILTGVPANHRVVLYADRLDEDTGSTCVSAYQTRSTFHNGQEKMRYRDFLLKIRESPKPIVFDTQHVLEYKVGSLGVADLGRYSRKELLGMLVAAWHELDGEKNVVEIHWNDCDPALGNTGGRNVWPGFGVLPLDDFANFLKREKWYGIVVPEIPPNILFPHSATILYGLLHTVKGYFSW